MWSNKLKLRQPHRPHRRPNRSQCRKTQNKTFDFVFIFAKKKSTRFKKFNFVFVFAKENRKFNLVFFMKTKFNCFAKTKLKKKQFFVFFLHWPKPESDSEEDEEFVLKATQLQTAKSSMEIKTVEIHKLELERKDEVLKLICYYIFLYYYILL